MAANVASVDLVQFPLDELRVAAAAAAGATGDDDYLQQATHQLSRLVGTERCALLVLREGRLWTAGAVGLPEAFLRDLDGFEPGPHRGTCGAAAARGRPVTTHDIREDPKWEGFADAAEAAGLRACWSVPLLQDGVVLGTFASYHRAPHTPDPDHVELAAAHASLVALGLDRLRREDRLLESYDAVVVALSAALDVRDEYTGEHSTATATMAMDVGRRLGLDATELRQLEQAARLHDIGKLGIPTEILHAPRPLTPEERETMEQHPVIGERILRGIPHLEGVARAVRHEHERWDGRGYPDGLAGEAIPMASRVVFACDAWHAMTSDRPYRRALGDDVARGELVANAGSQFDPRAVRAVLEVTDGPGVASAPLNGEPSAPHRDHERDPAELLAAAARAVGAEDLFVFRQSGPGHYAHLDGSGRGAGWAGNVECDAADERHFAEAAATGDVVCLAYPDRGRVVGPYYARTAAIVPFGRETVVVVGSSGDGLRMESTAALRLALGPAAAAVDRVPPAKVLADELEVLEAVRAVAAIPAAGVEDTLSRVAEVTARSLSCEFGGLMVFDDGGEMRVGVCDRGWRPPGGAAAVERLAEQDRGRLELPLLVQDVAAHPIFGEQLAGTGAAAIHAVAIGEPAFAYLFVVHAEPTPRGFTVLCQRLARSVADAAEVVVRRALAQERLAESRS